MANTFTKCQRCGCTVKTFSSMRKWCFDCRKLISLEQAKERKVVRRKVKWQDMELKEKGL